MNLTSFGLCLFACIYIVNIYTVVGYGESCTDNSNCTQNSEICTNGNCTCNTGSNYFYNGNQCALDECASNPCENGGTCSEALNGYTCSCVSGYEGNNCQTDINECSPNPCKNGTCTDAVNRYTCSCFAGYTGTNCETDINECSPNPCKNGTCTDAVNRYTCSCFAGYTGTNCETDINECSPNPCQHGTCTDAVNRYTCSCFAGYTGTNCETDINECSPNPCKNGTCTDAVNKYTCSCFAGYTGTNCDTDINECSPNPCKNGTCTDAVNRYTCSCFAGYTGTNCDTDINECDSNPCQHGTCIDAVNRYTCSCFAGYTGINCQTNIDECAPKPCLNGGTCRDLINDFSCDCKDGYSAKTCSSAALDAACGMSGTSCQTLNAECGSEEKICLCESSYYKKSSTCSPVSELRVKGITFPANSVTTSGFKVIWTHPDMASYVNNYLIDWRLKTPDNSLNNGGNQEVLSSVTSHVISTGVTAGRTYTVSVTSKNTQTQSNVPRTTSVSKEQAAKPNKPGAIDKGRSDLHASAGNPGITLYWTHPSGGVSGYKLTLSDGTNTSPSDSVSAVVTFNLSWLRNGHRYNVTIQAKSELYGSQNEFVLGEIYREEIKTVVTEPTEPRSVNCKEIYDESIVLGWEIPSELNGDLIRYTVNVYDSKQTNLFNSSTSGVAYTLKIENLKPGTHYTFKVFTQNEQYMSRTSGETTCQTKAKLSDPPHDLRVSVITSRNFTVQWDKPNNTYSEENLGYVIQTREGENCIKEIVYRCSDCIGFFQPSALENVCEFSVRTVLSRTKSQLADTQLHHFLSLLPDTSYTVTAAAVNSKGRGDVATITLTTSEEVPQTPFSVEVSNITSTSFLVAWSINGDRPGKTNFTVHLTADSPASSKNITVIGFETRRKLVENLEEFWSYIVSVEASTSLGSRKSLPTTKQQTLPAAPGQISDFRITDAPGGNYTQMKVTWKAPGILQRNSIIKEYKFVYYIEENSKFPQSLPHETSDTYEYTVSVDVRPEQTYTVQVLAVNEQNQDGQKTVANKTTRAGVPINIETTLGVDIIPKRSVKNRGETRFTVSITEEFFTESTYGAVRATGLVACAKQCDNVEISSLSYFNTMDNWQKARTTMYRVTEADWRENLKATTTTGARKKRAVTEIEYTVGSDTCSNEEEDEYCNGPLEPDTSYTLFAVSCTNGGCLVSKPYGPFITLAVPEESSIGMIVGIVVAVVVVLAVVAVIGFIMIRRRRRGPGGMKPTTVDEDEEFTGVDPVLAKIPRKRPIVLNDIEEHVTNMHKDSNLLFSSEYEDLKSLSPKHSCEAADREENRMRNRYINIIPFDHSRVKLSTNGEDDSSDYINANYLPGYTSPREYIACQGAIPGTIDDFWRMVWEQNVSVIVMLTLCKEGQKIKCEQYWPDEVGEPKQYGDVVVEITSYSNIRTYDYRMFKITSGNKTRVIKHFHFLSWLDFQANVHHDIILDFIQHVRQHVQPPDTSGPMIIHCSAGVGRTGTYIVLDHLIQFINDHDFDVSIDIFDMVLKLRENRMHMVQTEQQYVFIHDCVKEIMDRKRREMDNIYVNQGFSTDENIYQNENLYANVAKGNSEQNTEL